MSNDQLRFEEHLLDPRYRQGEILGYWHRVIGEKAPSWPFSLFWMPIPPRSNMSIEKYYLRLHLSNYNITAPGGCFWDFEKNERLDHKTWPRITGPYQAGFRTDWSNPHELYAPWDRGGLQAHPEWLIQNPAVSWKSGVSRIEDYLSIMYEILNSDQFHGTNG